MEIEAIRQSAFAKKRQQGDVQTTDPRYTSSSKKKKREKRIYRENGESWQNSLSLENKK